MTARLANAHRGDRIRAATNLILGTATSRTRHRPPDGTLPRLGPDPMESTLGIPRSVPCLAGSGALVLEGSQGRGTVGPLSGRSSIGCSPGCAGSWEGRGCFGIGERNAESRSKFRKDAAQRVPDRVRLRSNPSRPRATR
jgi:hypothetical protein